MRKKLLLPGILLMLLIQMGCGSMEWEEPSEEVAFTILDESEIPEKMRVLVEEQKEDAFRISYEEDGCLYVGQGYGKKEIEGYEIEVDQCRESEHFLYVHTILTGPDREPKERKVSFPYIVFCVKISGKQVIFLN